MAGRARYYRAGASLCNHVGVPKFDRCYDPYDAFPQSYGQLFHAVRSFNAYCRQIVAETARCLRAPLRMRLRRNALRRLAFTQEVEHERQDHTIEWMARRSM